MPSREQRSSRATYRIRADIQKLGADVRERRMRAGLTLEDVGRAVGVSASSVFRTERAIGLAARPEQLARHADAVGLRLRILAFPSNDPIRDAPQVRLIRAFRSRIGDALKMEVESPVVVVPGSGDRRAFDALIRLAHVSCGVEAYTRFHDCQGQLREAMLKQRDAGVARLVIVVQATHANRRAVAAARDLISLNFPLATRAVLSALRDGRDPGANGLVFI